MNLRSRTSGLFLGMTIALGGVLGVSAQEAPQTTTADLLENEAYACYGSIGETDRDFGDFSWAGNVYEGPMTGTFTVEAYQEISPLPTDCNFTIDGTNLQRDPEDPDNVISASAISLTTGTETANSPLDPGDSFTVAAIPTSTGATYTIGYDLSGAIIAQAPDTYTGTITVTAAGPSAGD